MSHRMSGRIALACVVVCSGALAISAPATQPATYTAPVARQWVNLNDSWRFNSGDVSGAQAVGFDDSRWSAVSVPHTWNGLDAQDGGSNYRRGVGWYRRHYTPPAAFAGKKLWLDFAGASLVTDVWVNGTYLGQHRGGFARFRFDATSALTPGQDAVIAVKVSNAAVSDVAPLAGDFPVDGGIYRTVGLWATDPLCLRMLDFAGPGVFLRQRSVTSTSATVDVTTKVWNNRGDTRSVAIRTVITDPAGAVIAETTSAARSLASGTGSDVTQTVTIANPHLWQGKADPYRYQANVELRDIATDTVIDAVSEPLGLRSVSVDGSRGVFLNGARVQLHGVNRHQDRPGRGWAIGDAEHIQDFDIMDEMGVNALRTAHYQQDQKVYDLADERGYLVWAEVPLVNAVTDSTAFRDNIVQQMHELIRQNYNHPSILFWGIGNEQSSDGTATNTALQQLADVVTADDPDRYSTYAHNRADTSPVINHAELTGFNHYFGWYYDTYNDFAPWADNLHATQPGRIFGLSEYGAGASVVQHEELPAAQPVPASTWHPEEYQSQFHEVYWKAIAARPFLWASFVWVMFDFAVDSRNEGDTAGRNDKGLVTYDRATRKDAFYWYKANWTPAPFVYLTSRRFTDRSQTTTTIKVYGSVDSAVLNVNGVPVGGAKTSTDHIYTWANVTLSPGVNTITVTGTRDGGTYTDSARWTVR